jgi:hypothetical protein
MELASRERYAPYRKDMMIFMSVFEKIHQVSVFDNIVFAFWLYVRTSLAMERCCVGEQDSKSCEKFEKPMQPKPALNSIKKYIQ